MRNEHYESYWCQCGGCDIVSIACWVCMYMYTLFCCVLFVSAAGWMLQKMMAKLNESWSQKVRMIDLERICIKENNMTFKDNIRLTYVVMFISLCLCSLMFIFVHNLAVGEFARNMIKKSYSNLGKGMHRQNVFCAADAAFSLFVASCWHISPRNLCLVCGILSPSTNIKCLWDVLTFFDLSRYNYF